MSQTRASIGLMEKHNLTLSGLGRSFGTTRAVDGVSLDIGSGEFVGIIGRSGPASRPCCASSTDWSIRPMGTFPLPAGTSPG